MSKTDLVTESELDKLIRRLKQLNPRAPKKKVHFGETEIADILDIRGFSLDSILEIEPDFLQDVSHEHDDDVSSFVYRDKRPFDFEKLEAFFQLLIETYGTDMLRYKGILNVKNAPTRVIFQGVHMLLASEPGKRWLKNEQRESVMVFIGRNLRVIFSRKDLLCATPGK